MENHLSAVPLQVTNGFIVENMDISFFLTGALCLSAGRGTLKFTRPPRHDRGPIPGGNRSAASCLCAVLRGALYHYATRSPRKYGHFKRHCWKLHGKPDRKSVNQVSGGDQQASPPAATSSGGSTVSSMPPSASMQLVTCSEPLIKEVQMLPRPSFANHKLTFATPLYVEGVLKK